MKHKKERQSEPGEKANLDMGLFKKKIKKEEKQKKYLLKKEINA